MILQIEKDILVRMIFLEMSFMNDGYKKANFEWWYFHFISPLKFNIIIHPTDMYGQKKKSYVSVSMLEKSGEKINFKQSFDLKETSMSSDSLYIKNNILHIEKINDEILIELKLKDIQAKLNISKIVIPDLFNEKSVVLCDEIENLSNSWLLAVSHSVFCGNLQYRNKNIKLSGWAYHDHNWGNWLIHECYSYWVWGNFQNANCAITYYYLVGSNGEEIKLLNIIYKKYSTNLTNFSIFDFCNRIKIEFNTEISDYILNINNENEFKSHTREINRNNIFYSRYASICKLYKCKNGNNELLEGINETLRKEEL